jgi:hypothetical protein
MAQGNAQEKTTAEPDPFIAAMKTIMSLSPETAASIRAGMPSTHRIMPEELLPEIPG